MSYPIVILHGWNSQIDRWIEAKKLLNQSGFKVYIPQQPGFTSDTPRPWNLDDYANWLADEFDKLKIDRAILVCHSNGGRIGMKFVANYPQKVGKLFLINSAGIRATPSWKRKILKTIAKCGKQIVDISIVKKLFYKFVREHDYEKATPILKKTLINILEEDLSPIFDDIKVPTYLIWGELDQLTPPKSAKLLNKLIPGSRLEWIENAKHDLPFTHPKKLVGLINKYVD